MKSEKEKQMGPNQRTSNIETLMNVLDGEMIQEGYYVYFSLRGVLSGHRLRLNLESEIIEHETSDAKFVAVDIDEFRKAYKKIFRKVGTND